MTQVVEILGCGSQEPYHVMWPVYVDGLEMQGVRASSAMVLTQFSQNILDSTTRVNHISPLLLTWINFNSSMDK